jgi:hypothetical protein
MTSRDRLVAAAQAAAEARPPLPDPVMDEVARLLDTVEREEAA